MPVRMTREGRAETREAKRTQQTNQESKSGKAAGFSSTSQKGNIVHGKLKSQKELKKITGSEDYKKSDYEGKTKMLNVATANKGMSVKQKKLAAKAPPPNKLDGKDFKVLREEKAKGRGMGLQDEKVQPGKVMKAKMGVATDYKKYLKGLKKATDSVKKDKDNKFIKRRMQLMGMPKLSKGGGFDSGTPGKVRDMLNSTVIKEKGKFAKIFGGRPTKRKMEKLVEIGIPKVKKIITSKKYMGGGMMQKPMGYSKGVMVKARGCKLGRTRPTKIT